VGYSYYFYSYYYLYIFITQPRVNNHPMGENLPNLVTLAALYICGNLLQLKCKRHDNSNKRDQNWLGYSVLKTNIFSTRYICKNSLAYNNAGVAAVNSGAIPTLVSYNASAVKIYNATSM
jgi:hypothetical protein